MKNKYLIISIAISFAFLGVIIYNISKNDAKEVPHNEDDSKMIFKIASKPFMLNLSQLLQLDNRLLSRLSDLDHYQNVEEDYFMINEILHERKQRAEYYSTRLYQEYKAFTQVEKDYYDYLANQRKIIIAQIESRLHNLSNTDANVSMHMQGIVREVKEHLRLRFFNFIWNHVFEPELNRIGAHAWVLQQNSLLLMEACQHNQDWSGPLEMVLKDYESILESTHKLLESESEYVNDLANLKFYYDTEFTKLMQEFRDYEYTWNTMLATISLQPNLDRASFYQLVSIDSLEVSRLMRDVKMVSSDYLLTLVGQFVYYEKQSDQIIKKLLTDRNFDTIKDTLSNMIVRAKILKRRIFYLESTGGIKFMNKGEQQSYFEQKAFATTRLLQNLDILMRDDSIKEGYPCFVLLMNHYRQYIEHSMQHW